MSGGRVVAVLAVAALGGCGHAAVSAPRPDKSVQLNAPGAAVDIVAALPDGYVTVVDFWSESCHACVELGGLLAVGVAHDPRIVIRKVDVGDGFTPVATAYHIDALPHFLIYDKRRRLRYDLVGSDCVAAAASARTLADE